MPKYNIEEAMLRIATLFTFGIVGCVLTAGAPAGEKKTFKSTPEEMKLLELTNQERKKKEVASLRISLTLSKVARAHS